MSIDFHCAGIRNTYATRDADAELERFIDHIGARVEGHFPLVEHDYWTIWSATKPAS
jgi:hypothetical protein